MLKRQVRLSVGHCQSIRPALCAKYSASYFTTSTAISAEGAPGKDSTDAPTNTKRPNRRPRHQNASKEGNFSFDRSAGSRAPSSPSPSSPKPSNNFAIRYESQGSHDQVTQSRERATVPSSLKDRLRQRAVQRQRQSSPPQSSSSTNRFRPRTPLQSSPPDRTFPSRDNRSARSSLPQRRPSREGEPRPRVRGKGRAQRSDGDSTQGRPFTGHEYFDHSPEARNLAIQEAWLAKRAELKKNGEKPGEMTEEEKRFLEVMETRKFNPDADEVVKMPKGLHGETLGSGLKPEEHFERVDALARTRREGGWTHVRVGEEIDVEILSKDRLSAGDQAKQNESKEQSITAEAISDKWVKGQYDMELTDDSKLYNDALRGVMVNKSYSSQDQEAFMQQFEKIVGSKDSQPTGKVADAVKAGAREAAMSKGKRAPHLRG